MDSDEEDDDYSDESDEDDDFDTSLGDDEEDEDLEAEDDIENRISAMEELLQKIADKLDVGVYDDEPLYDDETEDEESEESEYEYDEDEDEEDVDGFEEETEDVFESANYRRLKNKMRINEEQDLDDFGKHPSYQKEPMSTPSNSFSEEDDYYDMDDDSVKEDDAFGEEIGDGAPFEIDPKMISNAIAESVKRYFSQKKN